MNNNLEKYFEKFRKNTIGHNQKFDIPYGKQTIHYFDWTASGRLYEPIEKVMQKRFGPFVANTHSESSETGMTMTNAYHLAHEIIKKHINAGDDDVLLMTGTGATGAISKLQRILGLKISDQYRRCLSFRAKSRNLIPPTLKTKTVPGDPSISVGMTDLKPIVFITQLEHHSNHISWQETDADVVIIPQTENHPVDIEALEKLLQQYKERKIKIGSFTACSNVTGIQTPYHKLAKMMHQHGGYCFVDFAASAPYIDINMHPEDPEESLDAIFFSPHKFLGGPGSPGLLAFNKKLYPEGMPPETPGGGTVMWTNPWGGRRYKDDIESREDAGTPGFLQTIKAALSIKLKDEMGTENILKREEYLRKILMDGLRQIPDLVILADNGQQRTGIVSFYSDSLHYNLIVKLLNDRYGIQTRGGCSCAGTYGHCSLNLDEKHSKKMTDQIDHGDQSNKVGWARISLHPTISDKEVHFLVQALKEIMKNGEKWKEDYIYDKHTNEFRHKKTSEATEKEKIKELFNL